MGWSLDKNVFQLSVDSSVNKLLVANWYEGLRK